ncbi:NXPE family member 3-like [Branchiostoma floridae]|uniref:NXPE family member 3-like n=1 Tax=Branchiostoma floridae TaxID=7739 RepID=A0A9J7KKH6_BRAFL|nr:NXPE family member 3-like [Branchiostoma floridae]
MDRKGSGAVGIITDHQNGTYTATFRLLWEGEVTIKIQLVHPRQAIDLKERIKRLYPIDLVTFQRRYIVGNGTIRTKCNVDPAIFKKTSAVCNYSDPHAGAWWYCVKPVNVSCNTSGYHGRYGYNNVKGGQLYDSFSSQTGWQQCLKGKTLYFMGDSTIRQWWEHLVRIINMTETHIPEAIHATGPLLARDPVNNITANFLIHGPPLRGSIKTFLIKYVANAIDEIEGGPNDVVGITMWAHFVSYPVEVYTKRMEAVRAAIQRLLHRSPETLVVIKAANACHGDEITFGYWLAYKLDLIMRDMFRGMNVVLVDTWEMTHAQHWHKDILHPPGDIIVQELEFFCSFICPL